MRRESYTIYYSITMRHNTRKEKVQRIAICNGYAKSHFYTNDKFMSVDKLVVIKIMNLHLR